VVRRDDPAKELADLRGYKILFGPVYAAEKSEAAVEGQADAAVISSYALALLEGCNTVDRGALRVVARTTAVPFVTVFVTNTCTRQQREAITKALLQVRRDKSLLVAME